MWAVGVLGRVALNGEAVPDIIIGGAESVAGIFSEDSPSSAFFAA